LSRKRRGSRNAAKARRRLARLHARIACIRKDATHKATTHLVNSGRPGQCKRQRQHSRKGRVVPSPAARSFSPILQPADHSVELLYGTIPDREDTALAAVINRHGETEGVG
jgi:hypothetical protein